MRIVLGIEYDGYAFAGWQSQPHGNTVQDHLNRALAMINGAAVATVAAGRTDAGVHAMMQVLHFDTEVTRPLLAWVRGVNALLPRSIAVLWARIVDDSFHARFSALSRSYSYFLLPHAVRSALLCGKVGWCSSPLDICAMRQASKYIIGWQDFSSFRAASCQARSAFRHLQRLDIGGERGLLRFDLTADAFLHHMVRNIIGALVYIGRGVMRAEAMIELLAQRDRSRAPPTFMPDGLYLTEVAYPRHYELPVRSTPERLTLWS